MNLPGFTSQGMDGKERKCKDLEGGDPLYLDVEMKLKVFAFRKKHCRFFSGFFFQKICSCFFVICFEKNLPN